MSLEQFEFSLSEKTNTLAVHESLLSLIQQRKNAAMEGLNLTGNERGSEIAFYRKSFAAIIAECDTQLDQLKMSIEGLRKIIAGYEENILKLRPSLNKEMKERELAKIYRRCGAPTRII